MILPWQLLASRIESNEDRFDIDPIEPEQVGPASVDLRLGSTFLEFQGDPKSPVIDPHHDDVEDYTREIDTGGDPYIIQPGQFLLGETYERVQVPSDLVGFVNGRSSWARIAIVPVLEAGLVDPGYEGKVTLEFANFGKMPVKLYPGDRVCQFVMHQLVEPTEKPYNGKYQGDDGVSGSRINEDYDDEYVDPE